MKLFYLTIGIWIVANFTHAVHAADPENPQSVRILLKKLDAQILQAIVVIPDDKEHHQTKLTAWEFKDDDWQSAYYAVDAVIGRNGLAPTEEKMEGDGRTPGGVYSLGPAFGYPESIDTRLSYRQATDTDFWVDDPDSPQYNQWINGTPQAKSFERMKRDDDLYKYGVVIEYNTDPVIPGKGSAIFFHVWRSQDSPTSGCVAVSEENLLNLLSWLDRHKNPVIILTAPELE